VIVGFEPVLARLGPFTVRWFGLLLIAAVVVGVWSTARQAARDGLAARLIVDLASWAVLSGLIGARGLYLLENWEYFLTSPAEALDIGLGGLSAWGALAGGSLAVWLAARRRVPLAVLADAAAPALALGEALGRFGAFLNGDGQGRPTRLPWGTRYSSSDAMTPDYGVSRHPAQLYQCLADLAIFGALWLLRNRPLPPGARFWLWLGLYGGSRVAIGLVRVEPVFLLGLQLGQLLGVAAVALSALAMIRLARLDRHSDSFTPRRSSS
jgi:phosphatidylglycerol---prolipoprotein diacylglyceryl transferase